jgi:hypothetical protein
MAMGALSPTWLGRLLRRQSPNTVLLPSPSLSQLASLASSKLARVEEEKGERPEMEKNERERNRALRGRETLECHCQTMDQVQLGTK